MAELSLMDKVRKKQAQIKANMGGWWSPAEGMNSVRVMPSWAGPKGDWYFEICTHYGLPERKSVACLKQYGSECPVCDVVDKLVDSTKAADQTLASQMMGKPIYIVNAAIPNEADGLVKVWRMGEPFFLELLTFYTDEDYGDFSHPKTGYDFRFERTGTGMRTRYGAVKAGRKRPLLIPDWQKKLKRLDRFVKPQTRKEIRAILAGEDPD